MDNSKTETQQAAGSSSEQHNEAATLPAYSEKAQALLKSVQESLNEEKWTRASLGNYSTNQFKELDAVLKTAREEKVINDLKKNCDDHLSHTRNSIIALYISGMIALSRQIIDDAAIINLVSIFLDNHKWNIVKYLCERILDHGESKYALRTLADCYKNDNEEEKIFDIWERLVKVDFEEAEIVKNLAEHYEKQGKKDETIDFYKKALHRYLSKGNFANIKEIWEKLIVIDFKDIDFFLHIQKKIAKTISEDKAVILLNELYAKYKETDIDIAINILKIVLEYDERDNQARKEIIECYRKKYSSHSQLDEYIRISNLSQHYRAVHQAIADFEKHIAFDKGNFVYHRTWGVGKIASIVKDEITIDFSKKRGHTMLLKMAVDALQTLSKNHIWVLKATKKKEWLREKIKDKDENIIWALKTIIKSFGNFCDMKKIKQELSPALLTAGEWSTWSSKAREILKSNPDFGVDAEDSDIFTVRSGTVSITQKLFNEFTAQRNFYDKLSAFRDYVNKKEASPDSELFTDMLNYFKNFLTLQTGSADSQKIEYSIASFLLLKETSENKNYLYLKNAIPVNFNDIFNKINDLPSLFKSLKDSKLKLDFLNNVKLYVQNWSDIYIKLFPVSQLSIIPEQLEAEGYNDKLSALCKECFEHLRENREAAVWIYKNAKNKEWFKNADIGIEKQLIALIHVLDITYRDIKNNKDTVENRKINKLVYNILFKDGELTSYIDKSDEDAIIRIFTFLNGVKDLDPQEKQNLRYRITLKFPNFKFFGDIEKKETSSGLWVTHAMFTEKRKLLGHLTDVEIPANSKEIEYALSLGDLRENAEYKAALEKQEQLKIQVAKLNAEFEKAQLFDPKTINTSRVSFGTTVVLFNETAGKKEEYTILGPWESDSKNNIINYQSPFGSAILKKEEGERFEFAINDERITYLIEKITAAVF
ncbi:MAG: transcription elongation factor GreA [Treponema sp.]|nr:transcription elongation factor GreA [Treponema sp.]MCL2250292.1 transcription elongation factor GreA [Treponema sp.]